MNVPNTILLGGIALALLAGCETLGWRDSATEEARRREDLLSVYERIQKLEGRIEGMELEIERMSDSLARFRDNQTRDTSAQLQRLQARLDELDARIARVDAARERDKQELIDRLSAKISEIMARSAPASARSGSAASPQKKSVQKATLAGYEHEVRSGETLSAIAAAYGVSMKTILEHNDIKDPDRLRVGQKLFIPE